MKIFLLLIFISSHIIASELPEGIELKISLPDSEDAVLTIQSDQRPSILLTFTNTSDRKKNFEIYRYHPYHDKLPVPYELRVKVTDCDGNMNANVKFNGEWWTPYLPWSTTFGHDKRNKCKLKPGKQLAIKVPLEEILRIPFIEGVTEGEVWPWVRKAYQPGCYKMHFAFNDTKSETFTLVITE